MKTCRAVLIAAAATLVLAAFPAVSAANNLFTLDTNAQSNGHLIEDAAGNAYVAWTTEGVGIGIEPVKYCKIAPGGTCSPITLSIPGATSISESASAAFPVFGPGNTVYVVAPRYAENDVVFWTSTDGGVSFDAGTLTEPYSSKTNPTDVFLQGDSFLIGAYNAGLGFSANKVAPPGGGEFVFKEPGDGGVAGASMGLSSGNPVIAYWNISDPPYPLLFYRYKGTGTITTEASWEGPFEVTKGYEPSLSTGPAGLLMVSEDYGGGAYPNTINFRRYDGANFSAPKTLAVDSDPDLFIGGDIAQSPSGNRIAAVWPGTRGGDGAFVMRLFTSTDGGGSFTESHVARLNSSYGIGPNAEVATNDSGSGWVLFEDSEGLRLADLNPIAGPATAPPATTTPPKKTVKTPKPYSGPTKVVTKQVGDFLIVLRLPKSCLQSRQKFFVGVGKRKRKQLEKRLGGEIHFTKVVFIYDGKKLKVKKKKPFRYLVDPGPLARGSVHKVKAKVTLILEKGNQEKKIKRTIKGTVKAC
ncbi:MAG TPA: hypothetical protein VFJ61_05135 [Solirubrobacterales bacterium]|nr:hypothetical protein [Solirubrobacterales bacterium]